MLFFFFGLVLLILKSDFVGRVEAGHLDVTSRIMICPMLKYQVASAEEDAPLLQDVLISHGRHTKAVLVG